MALSSDPAVLIVGAGPTGLMLACQLATRRIPFRIIDSKPGPTTQSKALVVQPRSLEILEQMGLAPEVLKQGHPATAMNFIVHGRWVQHINFQGTGQGLSPYPFLYILEQSKTENLLLGFLQQYHLAVEWNTALLHVEQSETEVLAVIRYKDVAEEEVRVAWLTGADGPHSTVREQLGIPFTGGTYEHTFLVADTQVNWDFNHQEVFVCLTKGTLAAFFPMKGENRFRLVSFLPPHLEKVKDLTFDQIGQELQKKLGFPIRFSQTRWFSTYKLHHRYATHFQGERCFLVGDAAHIHSPAGGQGMNTGLQDAYNLAWKLALVIREAAAPELLHTYQDERLPVAKNLVSSTDQAFNFMVSTNPALQWARLHLMPLVLKKIFRYQSLKTILFRRISQIGIRYPKSNLSRTATGGNHFPKEAPLPGDRVPFVQIYSEDLGQLVSLYDLLRGPYLTLLVFKSTFSTDRAEQLQEELEDALDYQMPDLLQTRIIYPHEKNNEAYELFGISEDAFYLVRPDNYLAFRSQPASVDSLLQYLETQMYLYPPQSHPAGTDTDTENLFDPAFD